LSAAARTSSNGRVRRASSLVRPRMKIKTRKFAAQSFGRCVISKSRLNLSPKTTEMYLVIFSLNAGAERGRSRYLRNPLELSSLIRASVPRVIYGIAYPKIASSIIKSVAINMINNLPCAPADQKMVQKDARFFSIWASLMDGIN
jgi:hypothetical protein